MKKSEYLYGCSPEVWANLPYEEALKVRKEKAEAMLRDLSENQLHQSAGKSREELMKLNYRISEVYRAVQDNEKLLEEIYEASTD